MCRDDERDKDFVAPAEALDEEDDEGAYAPQGAERAASSSDLPCPAQHGPLLGGRIPG